MLGSDAPQRTRHPTCPGPSAGVCSSYATESVCPDVCRSACPADPGCRWACPWAFVGAWLAHLSAGDPRTVTEAHEVLGCPRGQSMSGRFMSLPSLHTSWVAFCCFVSILVIFVALNPCVPAVNCGLFLAKIISSGAASTTRDRSQAPRWPETPGVTGVTGSSEGGAAPWTRCSVGLEQGKGSASPQNRARGRAWEWLSPTQAAQHSLLPDGGRRHGPPLLL